MRETRRGKSKRETRKEMGIRRSHVPSEKQMINISVYVCVKRKACFGNMALLAILWAGLLSLISLVVPFNL